MSKTNSKEFWKILNRFSNKTVEPSAIDLQVLYDHFKKMNTNVNDDDTEIDVDFNSLSPEINDIINTNISADEIKTVVNKLKIVNLQVMMIY